MMFGFMVGYQYNLGPLLAKFGGDEVQSRLVTENLKADLRIWQSGIESPKRRLPIANPPMGPPITAIKFTSDAAGAAYKWWNGMRMNSSNSNSSRPAPAPEN